MILKTAAHSHRFSEEETFDMVEHAFERFQTAYNADSDDEPADRCPTCGTGPLEPMGHLGRLLWERCRACGADTPRPDVP